MSAGEVRFVDCHVHFLLEHFDDFVGSFRDVGLCGAWNIVYDRLAHARGADDELLALLETTRRRAEGVVHTFYWPPYEELTDPAFPKRCAKRIAELHKAGIAGVKVWKDMGLGLRDPRGKLVMLDDERLNPIWEKLLDLKLILIAHVADPAPFWLPLDESNPAYETLKARPEWHFGKPDLPSREQLFAARDRLHRRFPDLVIVNCHCGGYAESLDQLARWMDDMPNFYASLGRGHLKEGDSVAALVERHSDRILFETDLGMIRGRKTDLPWNADMYANALDRMRATFRPFGAEVLAKFAHRSAERLLRRAPGA